MASPELQQGNLELLILKTLASGALHGWAISRHIHKVSGELLTVGQGSLYPALYRLEDRGLVKAAWGVSPEGRRAKFYSLTATGRAQLSRQSAAWRAYIGAIDLVLQAP